MRSDPLAILESHGIRLRSLREGENRAVCPVCSAGRKNRSQRCLSIRNDARGLVWYCHHCGWRGSGQTGASAPRARQPEAAGEATFRTVPQELVDRTCAAREREPTALCRWLAGIFGAARAEAALSLYRVGRSRAGHSVLWLIDAHGRARQPRLTAYAEDGGSGGSRVRGLVPEGFRVADGYAPCMFGESVAAAKGGAPIVYVEAEKTALVGECLCPSFAWVAINGASNWRRAAASPLNRGRCVFAMFDPDDAGREAEARLRAAVDGAAVYQGLDTWPGGGGGENLADYAYNPEGVEMDLAARTELRRPAMAPAAFHAAAAELAARILAHRENFR